MLQESFRFGLLYHNNLNSNLEEVQQEIKNWLVFGLSTKINQPNNFTSETPSFNIFRETG